MKKVVIYYFSGTGNTWWLAEELKKLLIIKNTTAVAYSIEGVTAEEVLQQLKNADHIVIGFPVYGSTAPKLMQEFIKKLPMASNHQTATVFGTQALASGDTAYFIGRGLAEKGYKLMQTLHFRMMNNLHLPMFRFYPPKNDHRTIALHRKCLPKLDKLATAISKDQRQIRGKYTIGIILGKLQRSHMDAMIEKVSKHFDVNTEACVHCNKCIRICPTQNIRAVNGTYAFGANCNACLRCYSQCPQNAILIGAASADTEKFPRYRGPQEGFNPFKLIKQ